MTTDIDFFGHLARSMTALLNGVLREGAPALFRRSPEVVYGNVSGHATGYFHLVMAARQMIDADKGTFNVPIPPDRFIVYRNPSRLQVSFVLEARGMAPQATLRAYDRLFTFFFDNRTIEPIVPEGMRARTGLFERLLAQKAELRARAEENVMVPGDAFSFRFDYVGLYHSGSPLREELRTKHRVIEYSNDSNERSVL